MSDNLWDDIYGVRAGGFASAAHREKREARRMVSHVIELRLKSDKAKALLEEVESLVIILRSEGVAWSVIGEALGVSRQAAQQRFGGVN